MALDMVEVMEALGFLKFHVVGHDRGGRVAHRMARDHGRRVQTLTVLDISPTLKMYRSTTLQFAKAYYHWFFLIQQAPLPERLLAGHVPWYILARLGRGPSKLKHFDRRAVAEYVRAFKDPRTIHATCEDYRAAATIDLVHDKKDLQRKLQDAAARPLGQAGRDRGALRLPCRLARGRHRRARPRAAVRPLHPGRKTERAARRAAALPERPLISASYAALAVVRKNMFNENVTAHC